VPSYPSSHDADAKRRETMTTIVRGLLSQDQLGELLARGEGPDLDFKKEDYDWSKKEKTNAEFAKDLMAMGNALASGSEPAHIILGVEELEDDPPRLVGVVRGALLNDAALHQKVEHLLNRVPSFSFFAAEMDGHVLGVIQIFGGGRPFFPLKEVGNVGKDGTGKEGTGLLRFVPLVRRGSNTERASPDEVVRWARQDDPAAEELRSRELRRARADQEVRVAIATCMTSQSEIAVTAIVTNRGIRAVRVVEVVDDLKWNECFTAYLEGLRRNGHPFVENVPAPPTQVTNPGDLWVGPGESVRVGLRRNRDDLVAHLEQFGVPGFSGEWVDWLMRTKCRNDLGEEGAAAYALRGGEWSGAAIDP
jgi:hypothetical protein